MITVQPDSWSDFAIANPIPPEPPDIRATFPSNSLEAETGWEIGMYSLVAIIFLILVVDYFYYLML